MNLNLVQILNLPATAICPACDAELPSTCSTSHNTSPGHWTIPTTCTECSHTWDLSYEVSPKPPNAVPEDAGGSTEEDDLEESVTSIININKIRVIADIRGLAAQLTEDVGDAEEVYNEIELALIRILKTI